MTLLRNLERRSMHLARWLAGPERSHWLDAMENELAHLERNRLDWALGCLVAAAKDKVRRRFGLALMFIGVIALELAAMAVVVGGGHALLRGLGLDVVWMMPVALGIPMAFAALLARIRPRGRILSTAMAGFALHQLLPPMALWSLWGTTPNFLWGAPLYYLGIPPVAGLAVSALPWLAGVWLGKKSLRRSPVIHP